MKKTIGLILCIICSANHAMEHTLLPKSISARRPRKKKLPEEKTYSESSVKKPAELAEPGSIYSLLQRNPVLISKCMVDNGKSTTLYLRNLNISSLVGLRMIPGIDRVTELRLEKNQLENVSHFDFARLNINSLDLSYNKLTHLPENFFDGLNLEFLKLEGNPIDEDQKAKISKQCDGKMFVML